ncbi:MAG: hypothetical protein A2252_07230 [Elusimicrobia bacterium RIFOXYA2_FULL_39_19]|nr:MAG: hypothetical protein A2252_07230 [Elusimicrobia bacterium RIFOXYA2_FULL_39_19]
MIDNNAEKFNRMSLERVAEKLKFNGFKEVYLVDSASAAREKVLSLIKINSTVGVGGSESVAQIGLLNELETKAKVLRHKPGLPFDERKKIWRQIFSADYYIASPQAVTYDGEMYFIDKNGNRVAAVIFGPEKVILIIGNNKVVKDKEQALWRIRNVSAVKNAFRMNIKTPCASSGICSECQSDDRICMVITTIMRKPTATEYAIILVNEELGY